MQNSKHISPVDIPGYARLGLDSFTGTVDLVEAMHATIARRASPFNSHSDHRTAGISGLVYRTIRAVPDVMASAIDSVLPMFHAFTDDSPSSRERENVLAALNGVLGDRLEQTKNPLALPMSLRIDGQRLPLQSLTAAVPRPSHKILLLIHGLCMNDLQWTRDNHSHGAELASKLGYTEVHAHYNSGRHISHNGRELADRIEELLLQWPVAVEELVIVGHSMGGLLSRSALHYATVAKHSWPKNLRKLIFLGTPHHGAPLERGGSWLDAIIDFSPYTAPFTRLSKVRSAGITDLRYGNLLDEDWGATSRFERSGDRRQPLLLAEGVEYYALAATRTEQAGILANKLVGDGLVPIESALGQHADADLCLAIGEDNKAVLYGMNHFDLLSRPEVFVQLRSWLAT